MAGKLIGRFLHWLRQGQPQVSGTEHHPNTTQPISPPVQRSEHPSRSSSTEILSLLKQRHQQTNQADDGAVPKRPPSLPNPAARRAANPSNFRVLLSDHHYASNPAVKSLSHQLSHPQAKTPLSQDLLASEDRQPLETHIVSDLPPISQPARENKQQTLEVRIPEPPKQDFIDIADIPQPSAPWSSESTTSSTTNDLIKPAESALPQPPKSPTTITKQGVIKLLFKFKKNNHHGYITPNDGSKDIIFHQKYIDNDVFCQLERGMAVEVTAHITEGKAYAEHVRIL